MLNNMKMSQKLMFGSIIAVLFIVVVGTTGIISLSRVESGSKTMYSNNLMSIEQLNSIKTLAEKLNSMIQRFRI